MTYLGLDVGSERIGVAMGDSEMKLASPIETLATKPEARCFAHLAELIRKERVGGVVVGVPRLLVKRDQATEQQAWIYAWAERFYDACGVRPLFEDETLTSQLAERWQREQGGRGKRDDLAAVAILQGFFDRS